MTKKLNSTKTVDDVLDEIFYDKNSRWHQAYFDNRNPLHNKAVEKVTDLIEQKAGEAEFHPEVFPIVTKSGNPQTSEAAAGLDEVNEFIDNFDFGGEDNE